MEDGKEAGMAMPEQQRKAVCVRLRESLSMIGNCSAAQSGVMAPGSISRNAGQRLDEAHQALWDAILAFEGVPFLTSSGLEFSYSIKTTRRGEKGKELLISRREKTITRSTADAALDKFLELKGSAGLPLPMRGPKQLGTFGASYLYPLFIRFGLAEHRPGRRGRKRRAD